MKQYSSTFIDSKYAVVNEVWPQMDDLILCLSHSLPEEFGSNRDKAQAKRISHILRRATEVCAFVVHLHVSSQ